MPACPQCQHRFKIRPSSAPRRIPCPKCGATLIVPAKVKSTVNGTATVGPLQSVVDELPTRRYVQNGTAPSVIVVPKRSVSEEYAAHRRRRSHEVSRNLFQVLMLILSLGGTWLLLAKYLPAILAMRQAQVVPQMRPQIVPQVRQIDPQMPPVPQGRPLSGGSDRRMLEGRKGTHENNRDAGYEDRILDPATPRPPLLKVTEHKALLDFSHRLLSVPLQFRENDVVRNSGPTWY